MTLPADGLSSVQVQTVRLTRNAVRHISTSAFRGLGAVTQLDLSHNQISHLPAGVFAPLAHLRTLKLRYNRLADIGPEVFRSLPHLHELDLQVSSTEKQVRKVLLDPEGARLLNYSSICHYGKPRLCINIHHYAPPIGCSVTHRAATSLAAAVPGGVSEGSVSSFKSIS